MTDKRLLAANARVAHTSLRGGVEAERFVDGEAARVVAPLADLLAAPDGGRERQLLHGEAVLVLERRAGFAFLRAEKDGYCGYLAEAALGPPCDPTHWVAAPATHLYPEPRLKSCEVMSLSLGARLAIRSPGPKFSETEGGRFVPTVHLRRLGDWATDPVQVAESLLGTPYLWGGNSRQGLDCSGLVQAAWGACGWPCPADSDQQREGLGRALAQGAAYQRGDLFFWPGHVAIAVSADRLIHANGFQAAVGHEGIAACIARIDAQGEGPLLVVKRP